MTAHRNASTFNTIKTTDQAGGLVFQTFVTDLSVASQKPAALAAADTLQLGSVPAGFVLVPHLCRGAIPAIDSNGAPTGDYSIGTTAVPAALKASGASETAQALFGEDWLIPAAPIGSATDETPVLLTIINASATVPSTGKIVFDQVIRPYDPAIDG